MAVTQGLTRAQLLTAVGYNLNGVREITASANGSTTTIKFVQNLAALDDYKGWWLKFLSGANSSGHSVVTTSSAPSSGVVTATFAPAATSTTTNDTALLLGWPGAELLPERVYAMLNQALTEISGYFFTPVESLALHGDGRSNRFDIPSTLSMVKRVYVRSRYEGVQVHSATTAWDEQTISGVTRSVDTQDYRLGTASVKLVVGTFTTGILASKAITSLNISKYDYLEFWIKSTTATAAADLRILLDDTALAASPLETLNVPALVADTWTYVRVALANPETDTAIISVAVEEAVNIASHTVWISDVKAVRNDSNEWDLLDRQSWWIDKQGGDLVLRDASRVGYRLLKLEGGLKPALYTADGSISYVPEDYLIARTTGLLLQAGVGSPSMDAEIRNRQAIQWLAKAEGERARLASMSNVRVVA